MSTKAVPSVIGDGEGAALFMSLQAGPAFVRAAGAKGRMEEGAWRERGAKMHLSGAISIEIGNPGAEMHFVNSK
jgi:hypothetical protein